MSHHSFTHFPCRESAEGLAQRESLGVGPISAYPVQVSCGTTEGRGRSGAASCKFAPPEVVKVPHGECTPLNGRSEYQGSPAGIKSGLSTFVISGAQCETGAGGRVHSDPVKCASQSSAPAIHFVKRFSSSDGLKSRNSQNSLNFFSNSGVLWRSAFLGRIATYLAELMRRTLAPLRKIVSRELEVFEFGRNSAHPQSFVVHDRLECGHVHTSLLWDIFDLLNAYTESPHVRAIRHRCQECLILVQRKPVQSVAAVVKAA